MNIASPQILELALTVAVALGLKDLAVSLIRQLAAKLRARYRGTPDTSDDAVLEAAASLLDAAGLAARVADYDLLRDLVRRALALPSVRMPK